MAAKGRSSKQSEDTDIRKEGNPEAGEPGQRVLGRVDILPEPDESAG